MSNPEKSLPEQVKEFNRNEELIGPMQQAQDKMREQVANVFAIGNTDKNDRLDHKEVANLMRGGSLKNEQIAALSILTIHGDLAGKLQAEKGSAKTWAEDVGAFRHVNLNREQFDVIDKKTNKDGYLSKTELEASFKNPGSPEEKEFAAGALGMYDKLKGESDDEPLFESEINKKDVDAIQGSKSDKYPTITSRAMTEFAQSMRNINALDSVPLAAEKTKGEVVAAGGPRSNEAVISTMNALGYSAGGWDAMKSMVQEQQADASGNKSYKVTFPGDEQNPVTVPALTKFEMANFARVTGDGILPAVIEKALAEYAKVNRTKAAGESAALYPQDYAKRLDVKQSLELLTGKEVVAIPGGTPESNVAARAAFDEKRVFVGEARTGHIYAMDVTAGGRFRSKGKDWEPSADMVDRDGNINCAPISTVGSYYKNFYTVREHK